MSLNDTITLNVGGTRFQTSRTTLLSEPESMLAKMFDPVSPMKPAKTQDGVFFIDRDPDTFKEVLSYLRSKEISSGILDKLKREAEYFQLAGLKAKIQEIKCIFPDELICFNINGKYPIWIEREAFGNLPFPKIMAAVDGIKTEKDGNIIIYPGLNHGNYEEQKETEMRWFAAFAAAIRSGSTVSISGGNGYKRSAENVIKMKKEYANK
eukprot:TRINITY_DN7462_c0_g2_i1.p1 TRINITY_DN7462_c0_g2~~TRINITY_DN7462_c0_g2_i1.p1  ORF type:complete len:224 (-),score=55.98 TRINITY_DN7462_c0_g2_i1:107-733(-)